jgi:hypothetical protein
MYVFDRRDPHFVIMEVYFCYIHDVHKSVHRDEIMNTTNKMQLYRLIYFSLSALHVSGDVFARHQEHLTVFTVTGSIHSGCCRLVFWMSWNWKHLPKHVELTKINKLSYIIASCWLCSWFCYVCFQVLIAIVTCSTWLWPLTSKHV